MKLEFAQNSAYVSFEKRLRELHALIAVGEGDGEKADTVREAMADDYRSLSAEEVERLNGLSEDLYSLSETTAPASGEHSPADAERAKEFLRARQHEDWAAVLRSLRQLTHRFPASDIAFQRYQAYEQLGHPETAYWFLHRASELDPTNLRKRHLLLDFSRKVGREAEALAQVEQLLRDSAAPAPLVIAAADIGFDALRNVPTSAAPSMVRAIEAALERVMRDPDALKDSPVSVAIVGYTTLGYCRDKLGDLDGAMECFDQALKLDPKSDALRVARGLILAPHDASRAAVEFRAAVELESRLFHPYLFLAPYALGQARWAEAREFAIQLLACARDPAVEAQAKQWLAIAEFELAAAWPDVEALFSQAQRLDPLNVEIADNFKRSRDARSSFADQRSTIPWSRPGPSDFPDASASRAKTLRFPLLIAA